MAEYLIERNGYYYYFRRVPAHLAPYDSRKHVKISLKTRDRALARKRAVVHNETVEHYWRDLVTAPGVDPDGRYRKAVQTARLHGFVYRDITDLSANADVGELVDRLLAFRGGVDAGGDDESLRDALLGTAPEPKVSLEEAFDVFRSRSADRLVGKSENQIRKWENPIRLAMTNFIEVVGNKPITEVTRKDVLAFQSWWINRIENEGRKAQTANTHIRHVRDVIDEALIASDLESAVDVQALFARVKLRTQDDSRKSFEASYVQDVLLGGSALAGMNPESRALVYFMADTGARVAEIFGLLQEDIRLDAEIPYIHIRKNEKRDLKTPHSDRQIPLVGAALFAAQQFPGGLSRYSSADSASSQINKYFRENELSPTPSHSLYSLRHTFKDRLRDVQAPEEVIDNLMGHKSRGPKYGRGHILETKLEWLDRIAFDPSALAL